MKKETLSTPTALQKMGISWFVSYNYHLYVDNNHDNCFGVGTYKHRKKLFDTTGENHRDWLWLALLADTNKLSKNSLGLTGARVKDMATEILVGRQR